MRYLGFDWDTINTRKVLAHDLTPDDVEELFESGSPVFLRHPEIPERWVALGFVPDGRFVLAPYEHDVETRWVRVVTAYEAEEERWWRIYEKAKSAKSRR